MFVSTCVLCWTKDIRHSIPETITIFIDDVKKYKKELNNVWLGLEVYPDIWT